MVTAPLSSYNHLEIFSKALRTYVTPGQVPEVVQTVVHSLSTALVAFQEAAALGSRENTGEPKKKRRKAGVETSSQDEAATNPELCATSIALFSTLVSVVVSSVPYQIVQDDVFEAIAGSIRELFDLLEEAAVTNLRYIKKEPDESWASQAVLSTLIRLRYAIASIRRLNISIPIKGKLATKMISAVQMESVLPELRLELVRRLNSS